MDTESVTVHAGVTTYNTANRSPRTRSGNTLWSASYGGDVLNVGANDQADIQEQVTTMQATPKLVDGRQLLGGKCSRNCDPARSGDAVGRFQYQRWFDHVQAAGTGPYDRGYGVGDGPRRRYHLQHGQHLHREPGREIHLVGELRRRRAECRRQRSSGHSRAGDDHAGDAEAGDGRQLLGRKCSRNCDPQDQATLSGGFNISGSITFMLQAPDHTIVDTESVTVHAGVTTYNTANTFIANQVGTTLGR